MLIVELVEFYFIARNKSSFRTNYNVEVESLYGLNN